MCTGLESIPNAIGGQGLNDPEGLVSLHYIDRTSTGQAFAEWQKECYGDLGLRVPFAVQLQAYNLAQTGQQMIDAGSRPGPHTLASEQRQANEARIYAPLSKEGVLQSGEAGCEHTRCAENVFDISSASRSQAPCPELRSRCGNDLLTDVQKRVHMLQRTEIDEASRHHNCVSPGLGSIFAFDARETAQAAAAATSSRPNMSEMEMTSTGAKMESLGPQAIASLPFASAASTSRVPLPNSVQDEGLDWTMLISGDMPWMNSNTMAKAQPLDTAVSQETTMNDVKFDDMMFDMPLDEAFGMNQIFERVNVKYEKP